MLLKIYLVFFFIDHLQEFPRERSEIPTQFDDGQWNEFMFLA